MYSYNEDPYKLKRLLHEAQTALENAKTYCPNDVDLLNTLAHEATDLEKRLAIAWRDLKTETED